MVRFVVVCYGGKCFVSLLDSLLSVTAVTVVFIGEICCFVLRW